MVMTGGTNVEPLYLVIANSNPNAITRNISGHIMSENEFNKVQWNARTTKGTYTIPFGKNTASYLPLIIKKTTAGTESTTGIIQASTWYSANNTILPTGTNLCTSPEGNIVDRFWVLDMLNYSANPLADVCFYYNTNEIQTIPQANLLAQRWNSTLTGSCKWESPNGAVDITNKYVLLSSISGFGPIVLSNSNSPLPIELIYFNAIANNNNTVLTEWTTASESNNEYFTVERSQNDINFEEVGIVKGAGNSNSLLNYDLTDNNPYLGILYYRLKQTDFDGRYSYSNSVPVDFERSYTFSVYPNPFHSSISITISDTRSISTIKFELYNAIGVEVISRLITEQLTTFEMMDLPAGIYFYKITNNNNLIQTGKLISE